MRGLFRVGANVGEVDASGSNVTDSDGDSTIRPSHPLPVRPPPARRMPNEPPLPAAGHDSGLVSGHGPGLDPGLDSSAESDSDSLRALFRPRSVAVVGASREIGERIFRYLRDRGFPGPVYPVSASPGPVHGEEPLPSLGDLPPRPTLVFVAAPARDAADAVRAADDLGCGACVVVSSGFAESGPEGEALQERIEAIARDTDMRVVAPTAWAS